MKKTLPALFFISLFFISLKSHAAADSSIFVAANDTIILDMGETGITGEFASNGTIYIPENKEFYVQIGKTNDVNATYIQITSPDKVNGNISVSFISKVTLSDSWGFKKIVGGVSHTNYFFVSYYDSTKHLPKASNDTLCTNNRNFKVQIDSIKDTKKYIWVINPTNAATIKDTTNEATIVASATYQGKITVRGVAFFGQYSGIVSKASEPLVLTVMGGGPTSDFTATNVTDYKVNFSNTSKNATSYLWNFGDGQTSTVTNTDPISHTYASKGNTTVTLVAKNASKCPMDTLKKTIDVGVVSIKASEALIEIYPNPAVDKLQVVFTQDQPSASYTISNLNGMILKTGILFPGSCEIDVTALPDGLYFLSISGKIIKFLKK